MYLTKELNEALAVKAGKDQYNQWQLRAMLEISIAHGNQHLSDKIIASNKPISECWDYILYRARKEAQHGCFVDSGSAYQTSKVFQWAVHFYESDGNPDDWKKDKPIQQVHSDSTKVADKSDVRKLAEEKIQREAEKHAFFSSLEEKTHYKNDSEMRKFVRVYYAIKALSEKNDGIIAPSMDAMTSWIEASVMRNDPYQIGRRIIVPASSLDPEKQELVKAEIEKEFPEGSGLKVAKKDREAIYNDAQLSLF